MAVITPPKHVRHILVTLQSRGHLAYLVGGCVRDMLLGTQPNDWDICTSALPQEVMDIFPASLPTGIKHGTVTVRISSHSVEVTTFRTEGSYGDHRHPDNVSFVGELTADLSRRDFTMNAIALPPDGLLADPFNGAEDIKNRIVRCVGYPELRFDEDALRMFRALRFAARLGFTIDPDTQAAIIKKAPLAASLATERVRDEVEKMLLSPAPEIIEQLISSGLMDSKLKRLPLDREELARLSSLPRKPLYRWCALCVLLLRHGCIESAESFAIDMKLDSRTIRCCADCVQCLLLGRPDTAVDWKKRLNRFGVDAVSCAAMSSDILDGGDSGKKLKTILKSGECFSLKHLAVSGDDLLELGYTGRELGEMLKFLLDYVMEYPDNNKKDLLLLLARGTEEN